MNEYIIELHFSLNTFFILFCGVLTMAMAIGFTMLEAGFVRTKNTASILAKNFIAYSISCLGFLVLGYNIMFIDNAVAGILPSLGFFINSVTNFGEHSAEARFFLHMVFVVTSVSVVSGIVAERMKLTAFLIFAIILATFIYPVIGYWTWGDGFLQRLGFFDFSGAAVVHLVGGIAGFAGALLVGARKGRYGEDGQVYSIQGADLSLATLGIFMLWFGWFGFNGGSYFSIANSIDAVAVSHIFINTNISAAAGVTMTYLLVKIFWKKADMSIILNGAIGGLVAISADPLSPSYPITILIGAVAGALVMFSVMFFDSIRVDDPVGGISVHGTCSIWGLLMVPVSNPARDMITQFLGVIVISLVVFIVSCLVWYLLKITIGIRVSPRMEEEGVDIDECGLTAYPEFTAK